MDTPLLQSKVYPVVDPYPTIIPLNEIYGITSSVDENRMRHGPAVLKLGGSAYSYVYADYVHGYKQGAFLWLNYEKEVLLEGTFVDDEFTGNFTMYYQRIRRKRMEGTSVRNHLDGFVIEYDVKGNKVFEGECKRGVRQVNEYRENSVSEEKEDWFSANRPPSDKDAVINVIVQDPPPSATRIYYFVNTREIPCSRRLVRLYHQVNFFAKGRHAPEDDFFHFENGYWKMEIPAALRNSYIRPGYTRVVSFRYMDVRGSPPGDHPEYYFHPFCPLCVRECDVKHGDCGTICLGLLALSLMWPFAYVTILVENLWFCFLGLVIVFACLWLHTFGAPVLCKECDYKFGTMFTKLVFYVPKE